MNIYHTYYLDPCKQNIDLWDFNSNNRISLYGDFDHNVIANQFLNLFSNINDKTIIDIGCRDGFYSFLFEKLGNHVTAMDMYDSVVRKYVINFLNSNQKFIHQNLYNIINWDSDIKYDVVYVSDLLVHLENPIGALKLFHTICKEKLIILTDFFNDEMIELKDLKEKYHYNYDLYHNGCISHGHLYYPWIFSIKSLFSILNTCGYQDIKILDEFEIPSINMKSVGSNISYSRKVVCIEATPSNSTHTSIENYNLDGYKINPHFSSFYPNFTVKL